MQVPVIIQLRDVIREDLPIFFDNQRDPEAVHMAAFTTIRATERPSRRIGDASWLVRA